MALGLPAQDTGTRAAQTEPEAKTVNAEESDTMGHAISGLLWTLALTLLVFGLPALAGIDTFPKELP